VQIAQARSWNNADIAGSGDHGKQEAGIRKQWSDGVMDDSVAGVSLVAVRQLPIGVEGSSETEGHDFGSAWPRGGRACLSETAGPRT